MAGLRWLQTVKVKQQTAWIRIQFSTRLPHKAAIFSSECADRGGMVFTFLAALGQPVGASLVEVDKVDLARRLMERAAALGVQLLLPTDLVVADRFAPDAATRTVPADAIPDGWMVRFRRVFTWPLGGER